MTVTLDQAKIHLADLIAKVALGESVVITDHDKPVARLIPETVPESNKKPRVAGSAKGMIAFMADDFDAPLEDFKEYME